MSIVKTAVIMASLVLSSSVVFAGEGNSNPNISALFDTSPVEVEIVVPYVGATPSEDEFVATELDRSLDHPLHVEELGE